MKSPKAATRSSCSDRGPYLPGRSSRLITAIEHVKPADPLCALGTGCIEKINPATPCHQPRLLAVPDVGKATNRLLTEPVAMTSSKVLNWQRCTRDSGYGRDTIEPLAILSKKYGFEDIEIPVPHPGEQQQTQWQQIKQANADWVFLRGWGVMNPVAIKTAARAVYGAGAIVLRAADGSAGVRYPPSR